MDDIFQNIGNKLTLSQRIERTIENAIRNQDGNKAQLIMKDHLDRTREIYSKHMKPEFS